MKIRNIKTMMLAILLAGCASKPKVQINDVTEGNWKAKSLVTDKEGNRSYIVYLNFNAVRDRDARMDVTTSLGTGVASLVVDQKETRYVLLDQKRYYYGPSQPEVMKPILALPFNPKWIHNILFEEQFAEKTWNCERDKEGWLSACTDATSGTKVSWSSRKGPTKSITIEHAKASVQINVQSFKPKLEDRKNLFVLEAPTGYQKMRVR